jgi:DNA polymerase III subunit epsilon
MYAVIDLETTGLRSAWHDRVAEIGIVQLDAEGAVQRQWSTLVNPDRDLGAQRVHGIAAVQARRAPTFAQIAGDVVDLLRGRVVVAHNLAFDGPFLASEYDLLGVTTPLGADSGLCTMRLAGWFLPGAGRSLASCCAAAGVELRNAHCALDDARAAAGLLRHYLSISGATTGPPPSWARLVADAPSVPWPALSGYGVPPVDRETAALPAPHFLSRLVDRLPRVNQPAADAYLDMLDRALLDGYISVAEADALVATAADLGFGQPDVRALHESYLCDLAGVAADEGPLSPREYQDLLLVSALLGLTPDHVEDALRQARLARREPAGRPSRFQLAGFQLARFQLAAGDVVVFTGQTPQPRPAWEDRAVAAGLVVADSVTRNTRLLVAADPDTMSGKADRAHRYGIPVVHPAAFARLLEGMTSD